MTAVELAVVIGIVVILAVVVLTSVHSIRDKPRTSACRAELAKIQTAVASFRALPPSQNPGGAPPASMAVLKFSGLLEGNVGRYVTYARVRSDGRWQARYTNGPKGNCLPG